MIKLYHNPRSRAVITQWMLEECGAQYELVHVDFEKREHKAPDFLAINPAGKLPALVDGDARLFENAAICLYLADKFPDKKLAPPIDHPLRGRYLSWVVYSTAQLDPAMGDAFAGVTPTPTRGWTDFETACDAIAKEIGDKQYILGDWFTSADVLIGSTFGWRRIFGAAPLAKVLEDYTDRVLARPAAAVLRG